MSNSRVYLPLRAIGFLRRKLHTYNRGCPFPRGSLRANLGYYLAESAEHFLLAIQNLFACWIILRTWLAKIPIICVPIRFSCQVWERLRGLNVNCS